MAKLLVKTEGIENPILELRLGVNRLGRSPEHHLHVDHPTISALHCELVLSGEGLLVRDCNSTNGTYVNGQRVMEAALHTGETFQLGNVELFVERAEATVAIPQIEHPQPVPPVILTDGVMLCPRHPQAPVTYQCTECHEVMCGVCAHHMRLKGGNSHDLCPLCSSPCRFIGVKPPKKKSLLEQFKQTVRLALARSKPPAE